MYVMFSVIKFKHNFRNKFNILMEILEPLLFFIVYMYIFQALFKGRERVDGYTVEMTITSILLVTCLLNACINHELFIQKKLKEGAFLTELMKPVDFCTRMLFENIGTVVFRLCFQGAPIILMASMITELEKPAGISMLLAAILSSILGYLLYWYLNLVINEIAFFNVSVWALVVIKNGIIEIFGGMLLPFWFMPEIIKQILYFTPFPYLFQIPANIYLGLHSGKEIACFLFLQFSWILLFAGIGRVLWKKGFDKILERGV